MNRRLSFPIMAVSCLLLVMVSVDNVPGQGTGKAPPTGPLTENTRLRPVGWKEGRTLLFGPGPCRFDSFDGGVQSCTLAETVELPIWNTTRRETFTYGFIRFEASAGGVKEGVLANDTEQCVVNTASNSKKRLTFAGKSATVEYGYDGCVMKGTLVREETLRKWDGTSEKFPAGSVVEFNGAGDVIRGAGGPGTTGPATGADGAYQGTCNLECWDNPGKYLHPLWPDSKSTSKAIPFNFTAAGGVFQGGHDTSVYSLKWLGNYDGSGKITKGMMTGWIEIDHPSYRPLDKEGAWEPPRGAPPSERYPKLRWTITGPIEGALGPPAAGTLAINTPNDVVNDERPEPTDRLRIPTIDPPKPAGGIITCGCNWTATKGGLDLMPTVEGTVVPVKTGAAGSLDLIFVIDQTSSMGPVFAQVQKTAKQIMASITAAFPDYRVAIVAYRDWGDTEMFKDFPFTTSASEFQSAIDSLKAQGGGDTPEAVLEALLRALRLPWRPGVNKQIILMGDAPPHSPVPQGPDMGKTADDVVKLAFEVDPAVINSIATAAGGSVSKDTLKAFEDLAMRTKGAAVTADKAEEVPKKIMDVVGSMALATPPAGGGGGGGGAPVLPGMGLDTTMILAVVLLGACVLLVVAIVVVRQRVAAPDARAAVRGAAGPKVNAGLNITFADGSATQFRITGMRTTIGRGEDNVLVVRDGETSTHHAEIVASREGFRLRDVGSANGTTVNGQPATDVALSVGDEIGMGTTRLTFTP